MLAKATHVDGGTQDSLKQYILHLPHAGLPYLNGSGQPSNAECPRFNPQVKGAQVAVC